MIALRVVCLCLTRKLILSAKSLNREFEAVDTGTQDGLDFYGLVPKLVHTW